MRRRVRHTPLPPWRRPSRFLGRLLHWRQQTRWRLAKSEPRVRLQTKQRATPAPSQSCAQREGGALGAETSRAAATAASTPPAVAVAPAAVVRSAAMAPAPSAPAPAPAARAPAPELIAPRAKREEAGKYWSRRYELFSRFDEGIALDKESWYSVTPEHIARHIARRMAMGCPASSERGGRRWIDAFCGAGGNAIQMAIHDPLGTVVAIDIDPRKVELAKHNAQIYGVLDRIQFIVGDFIELAPELRADAIHLSPPWGGPDYTWGDTFDLATMRQTCGLQCDGFMLHELAQRIAPSVCYYIPRNTIRDQLETLAARHPSLSCELQQITRYGSVHVLAAYYDAVPTIWLRQRPAGMHTKLINLKVPKVLKASGQQRAAQEPPPDAEEAQNTAPTAAHLAMRERSVSATEELGVDNSGGTPGSRPAVARAKKRARLSEATKTENTDASKRSDSDSSEIEMSDQPPAARAAAPVKQVGSLLSTARLDSIEAGLSIPGPTGAAALSHSLQRALPNKPQRLMLPRLSEKQARRVEQAQLASTIDPARRQQLPCDGVAIASIPVWRGEFARLRTSKHRRDLKLSNVQLYLNDEVINAWAKVVLRSGFRVQVFTSLFVACLWKYQGKPTTVEYLLRQLQRLQRELQSLRSDPSLCLLDLDAWVLPRNMGDTHWTGAVINFTSKQIVFSCSLGSSDKQFCRRLWCLLEVASQVLRQKPFDYTGWTWGSLGVLAPQQPTPYDCGVFSPVLLVRVLPSCSECPVGPHSHLSDSHLVHHMLGRRARSCTASSCELRAAGPWPIWTSIAVPSCWSC